MLKVAGTCMEAGAWWDQTVSTPTKIDTNRPDMVVIDRETKMWFMVDFSVLCDANVAKKEKKKMDKYKLGGVV